jgi:hypothetical protein
MSLGFLLSSASGPVDSQPLKAKIENSTPAKNRIAIPQRSYSWAGPINAGIPRCGIADS